MLTKEQAKKLKIRITKFANAQENYSWIGNADAEEMPKIKKRFMASKKKLDEFISSLVETRNVGESSNTGTTKA